MHVLFDTICEHVFVACIYGEEKWNIKLFQTAVYFHVMVIYIAE